MTVIKFYEMEETVLEAFQGGEGALCAKMVSDDCNRILKGRLSPGSSIGAHCHATSSEILFVIAGEGRMITDGVEERLTADSCSYCRKGQTHTLINDGEEDLLFYAVVPQQ